MDTLLHFAVLVGVALTVKKLKVISCHSEDEIRRISISWATGANPCDPSLRSGRQTLCHTALDAVSQELSFSLITFPSSSTEGRRSSLFITAKPISAPRWGGCRVSDRRGVNQLDSQPFRLRMTEHCHCEPRSGVAIRHPKHLDCFVFLDLLTPHPSPLPKERENPVTNLSTIHPFNLSTKEMLDSQPFRLRMTVNKKFLSNFLY